MFLTKNVRAANVFDKFLSQAQVLELEKLIFDQGIIGGSKEGILLEAILEEFPELEKAPKEKLRKALSDSFRRTMASIMPVDISSIYEQTLVQHAHMYEVAWKFFYEFNYHKEGLLALKQKENLLAVISDKETLVLVEDEVIEAKLEYDFSRLKGENLTQFLELLEKIGLKDQFPDEGYVEYEEIA